MTYVPGSNRPGRIEHWLWTDWRLGLTALSCKGKADCEDNFPTNSKTKSWKFRPTQEPLGSDQPNPQLFFFFFYCTVDQKRPGRKGKLGYKVKDIQFAELKVTKVNVAAGEHGLESCLPHRAHSRISCLAIRASELSTEWTVPMLDSSHAVFFMENCYAHDFRLTLDTQK